MQIHINRNGQQFGPYSPEELQGFLQQGSISASDWAWHEGLANWVQISHLDLGLGHSQAVAEVVPQPAETLQVIETKEPVDAAQIDPGNSGVNTDEVRERLRRLQRDRSPGGNAGQRPGVDANQGGSDTPEKAQPEVFDVPEPKQSKVKLVALVASGVCVVGMIGYAVVHFSGPSGNAPLKEKVSEAVNNEAVSKLQDIGAHVTRDQDNQINGIEFPGINITTNGWSVLVKLRNIQKLNVVGCGIDDTGAVNLRNFVHLTHLNLSENEITDKSVEVLKTLTQLQSLNLVKTKVTKSGVTTLQAALPDCFVER
jgi:hypothetical protein